MTSVYRTGNCWGVTIVRGGIEPSIASGYRRPDDELVAVVVNGDVALAERICALLNTDGQEPAATVRHVEGCHCRVSDGAVLNVDLRCDIP